MYLKHFILYLFLVLCSKCSTILYAQNYTLSNWTVEDGLSSDETKGLLQDKDRFIWVATAHGLNKFDGYTFEKFRFNPNDSTSMGANYINNFCQDEEGNIWVNLGLGIVSKYDKLSENFINYRFENYNTGISDIEFVEGWGICIATNKGLFTVDHQTNKLCLAPLKKRDNKKSFFKIFKTSKQRIYLNTNSGAEIFKMASNSLDAIFLIEQSDTVEFNFPIDKLYEDAKGHIWLQTLNGHVFHSADSIYFKKSLTAVKEFKSCVNNQLFISDMDESGMVLFSKSRKLLTYSDSLQSWSSIPERNETIHFSFTDKAANIWVCTHGNSLLKWNGESWDFIISLGEGLKYWEIIQVFVDSENGIWFATNGKGIWRVYNRKWPISNLKKNESILSINFEITALAIDNEEYMWVGANQNLYRYYFETEQLINIFSGSRKKHPFPYLRINDITRNVEGDICIASNQGVIIMKEDGRKYSHHNAFTINGKKYKLNYTRSILPDHNGKMWIGTRQGLFIYDSETEQFNLYSPFQKDGRFIGGNDIQCIAQVNDTSFLVGYTKYGADLLILDPIDYSVVSKRITYDNSKVEQSGYGTINTFYHADSEYWAGSFSRGLLKIDLDSLTMRPLSEDSPIIPNVRGIQKGAKGNLWVSSIDGLWSVNPTDHTYYRFSKASGLSSNHFNLNSAVQDHFGNLYFGNKNGLNKIEPSEWSNQDTVATPILTEFKIYDKSITFDTFLNEVETIHLSPQDDHITFKFVSPTYDNPHDVQYAYQLEGFKEKWLYCENQRSVTYTNLKPGEYVFKIRAGNKGGFLNSKTKKICIVVAPPFWQTSWFIFFAVVSLIFSIWIFNKIQRQARINKLKTISEIRKKAADDFHDELGHRLIRRLAFL